MKTITLIGMMGSGKTSVGKYLGEKLNIPTIDMDTIIEISQGKTIPEIFKENGEECFRKLEKETIKNIFRNENMIISTGGGAFEEKSTRDFLLNNSTVIYLETSPENILLRIKEETNRPLLQNNMNIETIKKIINIREKNYKSAHLIISTDNKTPQIIAEEILGAL